MGRKNGRGRSDSEHAIPDEDLQATAVSPMVQHIAGLPEGAMEFKALPGQPLQRLDAFLTERLPSDLTRSRVQRAIRDSGVLINGTAVEKLSHKVRLGDCVVWLRDAVREAPGLVLPEAIPLEIYHEDHELIVLEKPVGMTVHPAGGLRSGTLVNALLHHTGCKAASVEETHVDGSGDDADCGHLSGLSAGGSVSSDSVIRPGIVHRLDRGTSGVMVVAKHNAAHAALAAQFAARTSRRTYLALVWGLPVPREGTVTGSIGRDPADRLRMTVVPTGKGKPATTHYKVLKSLDAGHAALVCYRLETGRTHQVRVHSRHMGHPLLGDATYGGAQLLLGPKTKERTEVFKKLFGGILIRPALHATTLEFSHPKTNEWLRFESPLPRDFEEAMRLIDA